VLIAMPHFLMNLRNVPDDEADDVRALLDDNNVDYYETPPSRWGISMGGFWARDADEAARAKALLKAYQQQRFTTQKALYEQQKQEGSVLSFGQRLWRRPVTVLAVLVAVVFILALSIGPFIGW
tara:strand:- start:51632 stop:52003 length:372 start_codon:yes stop_codon:yes gene_type:complete